MTDSGHFILTFLWLYDKYDYRPQMTKDLMTMTMTNDTGHFDKMTALCLTNDTRPKMLTKDFHFDKIFAP